MFKPLWLYRTLLVTTAVTVPGLVHAQDTNTTAMPPQPTEEVEQQAEEASAPDISAPGEIIVTGRVNRDPVRSSDQVVSVLSTEDIARTGEGDIAGALGRVTGLSVVGNGLVYVRGLGDRYSLALLNGLPLPSPEPLRRVVPLDIFPTNIIASSVVQKSYSPNYPAEFGGGVINLTTIAVPEESFLTVGVGGSANTETTFHTGYSYYGSGSDWTGFDNGTRNIPPQLNAFLASGKKISDSSIDKAAIIGEFADPNLVLTQKLDHVPANWSGSLTGGTAFDVGDARVGVIATASYSNDWRTRDITQQSAALADLSILKDDFRTVSTDNNITVNGMLGIGVELGRHKFRFTNLYIRDTLKNTRLSEGRNIGSGYDRFNQDTAWIERQLIDSQFVGELRFGSFGIDLRGGYANSQRESPFETNFQYVRTNLENDPYGDIFVNRLNNGQEGSASVAFSDLNEDLWYGGIDVSGLVWPRLTLTAGYSYTDTYRKSSRRQFQIVAPSNFDIGVGAFRPDYLIQHSVAEYYNYSLVETTESDPAFAASLRIHGAYVKATWEPVDAVSLDFGARFETADQNVRPMQMFLTPSSSTAGTSLSHDYYLPAATITWDVADKLQLRLNASKTIARPQFRELIFQLYYDPEANREYRGNPFLKDSKLMNAEVRLEYYMSGQDKISLAGFWKKIDNPIETFIRFGDNGSRGYFANAPEAKLYGAEFEARKSFDLYDLGGKFFSDRSLFTQVNYTYSHSALVVGEGDTVDVYPTVGIPALAQFRDGAPLTGQSDHVANLQIGLESQDGLSQQTLLVNYASNRVTGRGDNLLPDIIESPGIKLDFVWRQGIKLGGIDTEWKFEARNILNQNYEEYQKNADRRIDVNSYDLGTTFKMSVSANF